MVGESSEGRRTGVDKSQGISSIQISSGDRNGEGITLIDIMVADQSQDRRMVDRADSDSGIIGIEDRRVERVEPLNRRDIGGGLIEDSRFYDNQMLTGEQNGAAADRAVDRVIILLDIRGGEGVVINRDQVVSTEPVAGTAIGIAEFITEAEAVAGHPVGEIAADIEIIDISAVHVEASRTALESVDQMDQVGRKRASLDKFRVASVQVSVGGAETEVEVGAVLTHGEVAVVRIGGEGDDAGRAGEGQAAGLDPGLDRDSVVGNRGGRNLGGVPRRGRRWWRS